MKLFVILSFLSLLLFVQCEDVTFSTILEKFYTKASKKGFELRPRLGFLLGLSNDSKRIIKKFKGPVKEFVEHTKMLRLINTKPFLSDDIVSIYNTTVNTRQLYDYIIKGLEFELPIENDTILKESYEKWEKDPKIDVALVQEIKDSLNSTALEYSKLNEEFKIQLKAADQARVNVENFFDSANTSFDSMFELTPVNNKKSENIVQEIGTIMPTIKKEQIQLLIHLQSMQNILDLYNNARMMYVEFMMGMRDSLL